MNATKSRAKELAVGFFLAFVAILSVALSLLVIVGAWL